MIAIVCMKWGTAFDAEKVNVLFRSVRANLQMDFRFFCMTDEPVGLEDGIAALPIPEMNLSDRAWRKGCWPKLGVFKPGLFSSYSAVLFLDLDLMVVGPLAPLIQPVLEHGTIFTLREWNPALLSLLPLWMRPDRGVQSSVFVFRPGDVDYIYEDFIQDPEKALRRASNDQRYLTVVLPKRRYLPRRYYVSFKHDCVKYFPLGRIWPEIRKPGRAHIVVFHGNPRPWDLLGPAGKRWGTSRKFGHGAVDWVRDHFLLYGDQQDGDAGIHQKRQRLSTA